MNRFFLLVAAAGLSFSASSAAARPGTAARRGPLARREEQPEASKAARLQEKSRRAGGRRGRSIGLLPVDLGGRAVDSWGFPGSSGYLGIGGLMGSPFRSGEAGGLVATDTLFDFGTDLLEREGG